MTSKSAFLLILLIALSVLGVFGGRAVVAAISRERVQAAAQDSEADRLLAQIPEKRRR